MTWIYIDWIVDDQSVWLIDWRINFLAVDTHATLVPANQWKSFDLHYDIVQSNILTDYWLI